jgi:hypothetical protein
MRDAMKEMQTGGGTSARVALARSLQFVLGNDSSVVKAVAGGDTSLSALQEFDKLALQLGAAGLRQALLPGAGRLTQGEFNAFQKAYPNWDLDPKAIEKMFDFSENLNELARKKQQAYSQVHDSFMTNNGKIPEKYQKEGLTDITQFDPWWNAQLVKRGYISKQALLRSYGAGENAK